MSCAKPQESCFAQVLTVYWYSCTGVKYWYDIVTIFHIGIKLYSNDQLTPYLVPKQIGEEIVQRVGIEPLPKCKYWDTCLTHYPQATAPDIKDYKSSNYQSLAI